MLGLTHALRAGLRLSGRSGPASQIIGATPRFSTDQICQLRRTSSPSLAGLAQAESQVTEGQTILREEEELRRETQDRINERLTKDPGRLFAVVWLRGHQHKVTAGDLVMVMTDIGAHMGSRIKLEKLLALGSQDFTLLGRPILPRDLATVEATVLEKTLSRTKISQKFSRRSRDRRIKLVRSKWTLLRINEINVVTPLGQTCDRSGMDNN